MSRLTVATTALRQYARTGDGRSALAWMEKMMSKTNDTNKTRELTEAELAAVSGGTLSSAVSQTIKSLGEALNTAVRKQ